MENLCSDVGRRKGLFRQSVSSCASCEATNLSWLQEAACFNLRAIEERLKICFWIDLRHKIDINVHLLYPLHLEKWLSEQFGRC